MYSLRDSSTKHEGFLIQILKHALQANVPALNYPVASRVKINSYRRIFLTR